MARYFVAGSFEALTASTALLSGAPFTVSIWINNDDTSGNDAWWSLTHSGQTRHQQTLMTLNGVPNARTRASGSWVSAAAPSSTVDGVWHNIVGVWASISSRKCYIDGSGGTTNGTFVTPMAPDTVSIAVLGGSSESSWPNGHIAECGVWNVALTDAEISSLAKGMCPLFVRPQSLIAYWPVHGTQDPEPDLVSGVGLTVVNTPLKSAHPRIFKPTAQILQFPPAVEPITASGSPSITPITASGAALVHRAASGVATVPGVEAAGVAIIRTQASGTPSITAVSASGTAVVRKQASGAVVVAAIVASGLATVVHVASDGAPSIAPLGSAGTAQVIKVATGAPSLTPIIASGAATVIRKPTGAASITPVQAAGVAVHHKTASGAPSTPVIEASGVAIIRTQASGTPTLPAIEAVGAAQIRKQASGVVLTPTLTASGAALVRHVASGAATLPPIIAVGTAVASGVIIVSEIDLDSRLLAVTLQSRDDSAIELESRLVATALNSRDHSTINLHSRELSPTLKATK